MEKMWHLHAGALEELLELRKELNVACKPPGVAAKQPTILDLG
jgi:hypothetical protein